MTCLVSNWVKRFRTERLDEVTLHGLICVCGGCWLTGASTLNFWSLQNSEDLHIKYGFECLEHCGCSLHRLNVHGIIRFGKRVKSWIKVGDIDRSGKKSHISLISEKAHALSGSVLGSICREFSYLKKNGKTTQRNNNEATRQNSYLLKNL